ncbi:predicted ATPase of the PP-loop superfamily implicated in cell cycle control [Serpentinimonas raichei]|uniref:tRNA(Ile)-lysidine synthase n=1 Tax=Serpentinimonas raichei TaxID=1458425 RepID=A0A060NGY3_9BURK|nr:predicted ATPase of the PP-loop superfamily implicated in cell cycle control [Serpentinimonas raichei]
MVAPAPAPPPPGLASLRAWAQRHGLPTQAQAAPQPWAVAYSGGADSTALLRAAHALWPGRVQALHIHHGLQPAAEGFAEHAQRCCDQLGLPLRIERVQAGPARGQSPEEAARQARYAALARLAQAHGAAWVLLGQQAQDQIETLLLALSRGAGLPGLAAMPEAMQRHGVCFGRPWLHEDGAALRQWLDTQAVPYQQDPSNQDLRYTRNRIRAHLLPALLQHFPASLRTVARSTSQIAQAQRLLDELAAQDLLAVGNPPAIAAVQALSPDRQANLLRHWLRSQHGTQASAAQLQQLLHQVAACRTRGHQIEIKVGQGRVRRCGAHLDLESDAAMPPFII